jgi:hypothetical protein
MLLVLAESIFSTTSEPKLNVSLFSRTIIKLIIEFNRFYLS